MTKREEERLNALLQKKEAEEKADKDFFAQVRKRKNDVFKVLGIAEAPSSDEYYNKLLSISTMYGCTVPELIDYISTERQIDYYKRFH